MLLCRCSPCSFRRSIGRAGRRAAGAGRDQGHRLSLHQHRLSDLEPLRAGGSAARGSVSRRKGVAVPARLPEPGRRRGVRFREHMTAVCVRGRVEAVRDPQLALVKFTGATMTPEAAVVVGETRRLSRPHRRSLRRSRRRAAVADDARSCGCTDRGARRQASRTPERRRRSAVSSRISRDDRTRSAHALAVALASRARRRRVRHNPTSDDIAPLLADRCAMCHHAGGSAPFSPADLRRCEAARAHRSPTVTRIALHAAVEGGSVERTVHRPASAERRTKST